MAMVNMNNLLNGKDSRWLQLEVCREFQRNKCSRPDTECKFAHPPANVEVQNGRVTACYDSIKGRCNREKPPCKYFHPPQHLKDQLLINGRNHLALKNALMQQMGLSPGQALVPGQVQAVQANPYLTGMPQVGSTFSPYYAPGPIMPTIMGPDPTGVGSPLGVVPQTVVAQQKMPRSDRLEPAASVSPLLAPQAAAAAAAAAAALEIGKKRPREPSTADTDLLQLMDMKSVGSFYYENFAFPGMMPYKRPAADKSGVPVYQPNATTYQQLMQLQQPFVPVSCEYSASPIAAPPCSSPAPALQEPPKPPPASAAAPQPPSSQQALAKDPEVPCSAAAAAATVSTHSSIASLMSPTTLLTSASMYHHSGQYQHPPTAIPDPATLAKEVAQQNYAKALKLASVNQSFNQSFNQSLMAASQYTQQLNPLNYTGVALSKQMSVPPPMSRYPTGVPTSAATGLPFSLNLGLNPYAIQQHQSLLNVGRPPASAVYPYTLMRSPYQTMGSTPVMGNALIGAQYPVSVAGTPMTMTSVSATANMAAAAAAAAAAQNNNNNVVIQPYKKLKTT